MIYEGSPTNPVILSLRVAIPSLITGIPLAMAFSTAGTVPSELAGTSTIADTFRWITSSICVTCF
jgi:hypothetical protein